MKLVPISEEEGVNILLKYRMLCYMAPSHTDTAVRGRPTPKNELRRFRNGLVRENLKLMKGNY